MGYLKNKCVYLAGNIHTTDKKDFGMGWRDIITPLLTAMEIDVINPCKEGFGDSKEDMTYFRSLIKERNFKQLKKDFYRVIRKDLKAVDKSDFLICQHHPKMPTIGTVHEIVNATNQKKPVLILCDEQHIDDLNPWLLTLIKPQWLFTTWDDMFAYLRKIDNGDIETSHWWM